MTDLHEAASLLRRSVHDFSQSEIAPFADTIDKTEQFPPGLWQKLGRMGLLGITVPEALGGTGMGYFEHVIAMEEISRASAAVGLSYSAHSNLCVNQLNLHGSETQKKKYLPKLLTGEHIGALAISESSAGSDAMGMQCHVQKKKNCFILNGHKLWITNGPEADIILVYAKTDNALKNTKHISAFIIEKNFKGFKTGSPIKKLGMRGSSTCELIFEDCEIPEENILGNLNEGTQILMGGLDYERVVLAGGPLGIMQSCLDYALPYLKTRRQFGKPIGEFQLMQGKLADMYVALCSSRAYVYSVAQSSPLTRQDAAAVILYASEKATQVALQTIQCLGANGYTDSYAAERLLRDAKLYEIGAGTSEIRRMLIGRELLKKTPSIF